MNTSDIQVAIMRGDFTNDDLNAIIETIRYKRGQLGKATKRSLKVGDTVTFVSAKVGKTITGTVKQIKVKNVIVGTSGNNWQVPASMLTKVSVE
jgi:hypothetical protein